VTTLKENFATNARVSNAATVSRPCNTVQQQLQLHLSTPSCFADKAQTGERSRNADGTLSGADRSTASDAEFWNQDDVYR